MSKTQYESIMVWKTKKSANEKSITYAKINDLESIVVWMYGYVCDEMKDNFESESKYIHYENVKI